MVDNPEQAAYIIEWRTLDDIKNFQSSPAYAEFLQSLPETAEVVESRSELANLTLDDAPSSRFLILKHPRFVPTGDVEGRVTLTSFVVPGIVDEEERSQVWYEHFYKEFDGFAPLGSEFIKWNFAWSRFSAVWFWALQEDRWVEEKFGKLERTQGGRTIFCHFFLWATKFGATPEHEAVSAADPEARESWERRIVRVMPPATAWQQERWDIREVPRFYPPEPELDPEEAAEEKKFRASMKGFLESHGLQNGELHKEMGL
ncbi:hypothetical protein C7999DRAFT_39745 [Corynascus novoguineensis]|uniref:ABM domain-containing protein n=1 Tax=Corynascus novoguineensis TaxID=1126955 RepID=A0AAN7CVJ2_9PEZI|nr:hypothetical protein C7999DRAFT_39745 [Corynascus novoguineensis]